MVAISVARPVRVAKVAEVKKDKREVKGRPASFEKKKAIAEVLRGEKIVSRFHMLQLVEAGYVTPVAVKVEGKRGRPAFDYELTNKGRGLVTLSMQWTGVRNAVEISSDDEATMVEALESGMTENQALEDFVELTESRPETEALLMIEFHPSNDDVAHEVENEDSFAFA